MRLRIVTPLEVVVDTDVDSLRAEDASGSFGILPGHAPFVTALALSIVSWETAGVARYCAVRGGVLTVQGDTHIATREAVVGDALATLDRDVLAQFQADAEAERSEHVESVQLQMNAIRRMVSRLQPRADGGQFR
jgi:F-type H+-transporting ATPase subunit epsilon